jgi:TonB family protein
MRNLLLSGALALSVLGGGAAHADNNVAPTSTSAARATVSAYIGEVSAELRSRLFYPRAARARGVVGVSFSIGPSGALTSFAITRSSGDKDLDAAARSLVQGARFPPPPAARLTSRRASITRQWRPPSEARSQGSSPDRGPRQYQRGQKALAEAGNVTADMVPPPSRTA